MKTTIERPAHAAGLEPGLPWASRCLSPNALLAPELACVELHTDSMAPRFPAGSSVVAVRVGPDEPLTPGVYVWQAANHQTCIGRLTASPTAAATGLLLTQDNRPGGIICLLEWDAPSFALYRVGYYAVVPVS